MAHSVSEPSPNRVTSSSGVRTTTTCSRPSTPGLVREGQPGGGRMYSHAYAALDLKPGMGSQEVNLVLRRGATVEGRVVGPDGQPVGDAWIFSRLILEPSRGAWRYWSGRYHGKLRNGRFEIRGLAPDAEVPVYFLEPERKLGAVVNLSVKSVAGGPVTVRLEPCGSARAWLVDPDGKPVAKPVRGLSITMVVTPGPRQQQLPERQGGQPALCRRGRTERRRPDQLRDGAGPRCPRPDRAPRPDPGRDVSLHRFHHVRPRPDRPGDPQGIHRQAGPEAQPGRYPNRQASKLGPVRLEQARPARLPRITPVSHDAPRYQIGNFEQNDLFGEEANGVDSEGMTSIGVMIALVIEGWKIMRGIEAGEALEFHG